MADLCKTQLRFSCFQGNIFGSHIHREVHSIPLNTLRPRQNRRHFADDIFKCIFLNENAWILIKISLQFVPKCWINNIPALVQIMAWRRPGDKPLFEPVLVRIPTHICVTRPQWVSMKYFWFVAKLQCCKITVFNFTFFSICVRMDIHRRWCVNYTGDIWQNLYCKNQRVFFP